MKIFLKINFIEETKLLDNIEKNDNFEILCEKIEKKFFLKNEEKLFEKRILKFLFKNEEIIDFKKTINEININEEDLLNVILINKDGKIKKI